MSAGSPVPRLTRAIYDKKIGGVCGGVAALYGRNANVTSIKSIAILPFTSTTRDADTEYLTDDVSEGIINRLCAVTLPSPETATPLPLAVESAFMQKTCHDLLHDRVS